MRQVHDVLREELLAGVPEADDLIRLIYGSADF